MISWEQLPDSMKNNAIYPYYESLEHKKAQILWKRILDFAGAFVLTVLLSPVMLLIALGIKLDTKGPVFYRQNRVTQYGKVYRIFKFRTMVKGADQEGPLVTVSEDRRVTRMGKILRKCRLDELPQLFNILTGEMSFVGTRPEVEKYVAQYSEEMLATLLLPAGITSCASILFKDEDELISTYQCKTGKSADEIYVEYILPQKMKYNLRYIQEFGIWRDLKLMVRTVAAVLR